MENGRDFNYRGHCNLFLITWTFTLKECLKQKGDMICFDKKMVEVSGARSGNKKTR